MCSDYLVMIQIILFNYHPSPYGVAAEVNASAEAIREMIISGKHIYLISARYYVYFL